MSRRDFIELQCERLENREMLSSVTVLAAGAVGSESMQLLIDGQVERQWDNIGGDAFAREFVSLSHTTVGTISPDQVRLTFTNDVYDPDANLDRNLRIDAIIIDGVRYDAEHPSVFSTGTWKAEDGIQPGFRESEFLHANGYMQFATIDGAGTSIVVRARGAEGGETFDLLLNESVVASYTTSTTLTNFTYQSAADISANDVRVAFTNDLYDPANGIDRDLNVDFISLNGRVFETEAPSVFSTGTWLPEDGVSPGFRQSENLNSNGYFQYSDDDASGSQIVVRAWGDEGVEEFQLLIDEVVVADFVATGQPEGYVFFNATGPVTADQVRVQFVSDVYDPANGIDQNLQVDFLEIDGTRYQTESPSVYSTGTWSPADNAIVPGFWQTETLHSVGYFQYSSNNANGGFLSLESSIVNVTEVDGAAVLTVVRTGGSSGVTSVDYNTVPISAVDGSDYIGQSGTFTFLDGETSKSVSIPLINDNDVEPNEQFAFTIDNIEGTGTLLAPRTATITIDDDDSIQATGDGLLAEYFDAFNFDDFFNYRVDSTVDFIWGDSAPQDGMGADTFTVRWTGQIEAEFSETYTFTTNSDDGIRLWVDDQLIINEWNDHGATLHSGTIDLVAGQFYDIKVEYYERGGGAVAQLFWSSDSTANEIVPQSQLYAADPPTPDPGGELLTQTLYTGLSEPTALAFSPDGARTYIAQKGGVVRVAVNGNLRTAPVLDFSAIVNGPRDRGLLDIAVHPDFANSPYLYLLYTYDPPEVFQQNAGTLAGPDGFGNRAGRLTRVTLDAATNYTSMVSGSEVTILGSNSTWDNFNGAVNSTNDFNEPPAGILPNGSNLQDFIASDSESHTVGSLDFGPDGNLYVSIGDGASYNRVDPRAFRVQDIDNLSGKVLRIDPLTGNGVSDNPFYNGDPTANRSKVYQSGLRNPFRISVHPDTGEVFIGEVGWGQWEEVNRAGAGANLGWPYYEGGSGANLRTVGYQDEPESQAFYQSGEVATPAIVALNHAADGINAIVGGDVYTGTAFPEQYQGDYFFNDLGGGIVRTVSFNANGQVASVDVFTTGAQFVVQIKQGPDGNLYFVNLVSGEVGRWTFAPSASLAGFEAASAPIVSHGTSPATGQGAVVALIDSGLDATHPDLVNVRWKNLDEINGDGIDNDNNGYVDDRFGYDFIQNDGNLNDSNGHGTAMTGIIAANDNGVGFVGFAPEADIMMLRVIDDSGLGLATDVALAIRYAVDNGADVINLPLVVQDTQGVRDAIAYAESNDVLIIVAAGNGSAENPDFPAFLSSQHANVLAVGAVGPDGQPLPESNRVGENGAVQVNALGVAAGTQLAGASTFRGTGVAASVVSSAAALAIELNPSLSAEQLRQLLVASAISDSNGSTGTISFDEVIDRAQRSRRFRFVETGSTFIVHGTDGNESFEVQAGASTLWVDGIEFDIPVGATRLTLQSRGGKDVLRIVGTAGDDIVTASDGYVRLKSLANNIRGNDFANVLVEGDDGIDVVRMQGTVNDDWFAVQEDRAAMRLGLEGLVATSFEKVRVNGGAGDDTAFILGTTENDQLTTRPGKARLLSGVLDFDFQKVENIVVDAVSSSGNDNASLRATTDDDSLEIGTTYALLRGATFQTLVLNFDATSASMGAGNDTTTLVDIDEPTALANHTILGGEAIVDGPSSGTTEDGLPESLDADSLEAFLQSLDLLI